jgi:HK97 family phage major capsid protein
MNFLNVKPKKMKKNFRQGNLLPFIMLPLVFTEKTTPEEFAKSVDAELELVRKGQINKDEFKAEIEKGFETVVTEKTKELQGTIEKLEKTVEEQEQTLKTQGEELAKKATGGPFSNAAVEALKTELTAIQTKSTEGLVGEKITIKAFTGDDAMGVQNYPNAAGNGNITGALASITQYFAQLIPGIFKKPVPTSNILDYCDVLPLTGEQLVTISETATVSMSVTAEGVEKPVSKAVWAATSVTAKPVPTLFKTTSQMRKFFMVFVTSFYNTLIMYVNKVIPEKVITDINAAATAFTPVTAQAIYAEPNDFDAIVQMIASLVKLGYTPNVAKVSVFTYSALKTLKSSSDGHYMLANNGSVNILDSVISFGDIKVKLEADTSFGDDDVLVGDLTSVKVGLDNNIEYYEAYEGDDFKKNKKSHLLEKYIAVNVPTALRTGITKDTLTNVKTLITAA